MAQSLTLVRGKKVLCTDLQLALSGPGLFFLTGPNGSGKTTLLLALAGLLPPAAGTVALHSKSLYGKERMPLQARAQHIVYLPQHPTCPSDFSALQLAVLGRIPHSTLGAGMGRTDTTAAEAALARVGFKPSVHQHMGSLSGGERQLVWLAQGLVQDGAFWLLDEPTQHLDAARRAYLFLLLQRLATDYGKTLLVATHELNALAQLPQAQYLDMLNPERGFVPCTPAALASTLEAHKQASGLF